MVAEGSLLNNPDGLDICVDNGPEFISKALDRWAYENGVTLDFSRPGKPTDNAFVESFNSRPRDKCLNAQWFLSLTVASAKIEAWRRDYSESCPHTSLGGPTPVKYTAAAAKIAANERRMLTLSLDEKPGGPHYEGKAGRAGRYCWAKLLTLADRRTYNLLIANA